MAKEKEIRKRAVEILQGTGWVVWWPPARVKFRNSDIFGAFDLVCSKKRRVRFIQLTTTSNLSARRKKVEGFLRENDLSTPSEVWGYSNKHKIFRIVKIC